MANLTATPGWDNVVQLETSTVALGGPGAPMNLQAQALLNRTESLRAEGRSKVRYVTDFAGVDPTGVTDSYAGIQAAIDSVSLTGGALHFPAGGVFSISAGLVVKCAADLPTTPTGSDLHFAPSNPVSLVSDGLATIKATASMSAMVTYIADTSDADIAPFYSKVEGLGFYGNGLATDCIYLNFSMHMHIERCRMWGFTGVGIHNFGYGVAQFIYNVIRGPRCIFIERGGDNLIQHNDFFPTTGGIAAVDCGYLSGNTTILANVFTREEATGNIYGVRLSGDYAPTSSEEVRHVIIDANEFSGMTAGVLAQSFSTGVRNVYQCAISHNHVTPFGATNIGVLAELNSSDGFNISGNWINKDGFSQTTGSWGLRLNNCTGILVESNIFQNTSNQAISMTDCLRCRFIENEFYDCGKLGTSFTIVTINATSRFNDFRGNYFYASSASYAQSGIFENSPGNNNEAINNRFVGIGNPYNKSGANSWFHRREAGTALPSSGRYHKGDTIVNTNPVVSGTAPNQYIIKEWVKITDGTTNVLNTDWVQVRTLTGT